MEDVDRRVDEFQDAVAQHARKQRDDHGQHHRYAQGIAHITAHLVVVAGAKGLRYGDSEACAGTVAEAHDEEHDAARRAHGS